MPLRTEAALLVFALGALAGCGSDNTLSGSIARTHSLTFDATGLRKLGDSYVLTYTRGAELVAKLVYNHPPGVPVPADQVITLDFGNPGNAALSRATSDGLRYPAQRTGTLLLADELAGLPEEGLAHGRFGIEFTDGQTLSGTFAAPFTRAPEGATQ